MVGWWLVRRLFCHIGDCHNPWIHELEIQPLDFGFPIGFDTAQLTKRGRTLATYHVCRKIPRSLRKVTKNGELSPFLSEMMRFTTSPCHGNLMAIKWKCTAVPQRTKPESPQEGQHFGWLSQQPPREKWCQRRISSQNTLEDKFVCGCLRGDRQLSH